MILIISGRMEELHLEDHTLDIESLFLLPSVSAVFTQSMMRYSLL